MKYGIRVAEDWMELLFVSLFFLACLFHQRLEWWIFILITLVFLVAPVLTWWKQAQARWCAACRTGMVRDIVQQPGGDSARIYYRCKRCGQLKDSGLRSGGS